MRVLAPRRAVALEHLLEILVQRERDLRPPFDAAQQQRRGLDGGEAVAARLAPELAVARRPAGPEHAAAAFQHPRIPPPQGLRLAPTPAQHAPPLPLSDP